MKITKFEMISFLFVCILGTILHFTFQMSSNNVLVGLFSPINESVWEHLKLLFFPTLITIIIGSAYFKTKYPKYLIIKTKGLVISLLFIIIFFYTYTGIIGKSILIVDILSFFISSFILHYYTLKNINSNYNNTNIFIILLGLLTILFIIFSFYPPKINLFKDPITKSYGIQNIKK